MNDLTLWDYWRMLGPLGKLLFLYIAAVLISLLIRSFTAALRGRLTQVRLLSPVFERSAISIALLTLSYGCAMGWLVCKGDFYGSDFDSTLTRALREGLFHFRVLGCAFSIAALFYFIGWGLAQPKQRAAVSKG